MYLAVQTNGDYYKQQTVQRLISFISTNGGITELAGYNAADVDPANDPAFASSASAKKSQLSQTMRDNAHFDAGTLYFATQAAPIAKITTAKVLPISNSNLAVGLLRKKGNSYELLGTTDDDDTLSQAVIKAYKRTNSKQSDTVRVITEIIRTQALPASMSALARKLADKTKILAANGAAMSAIKRLRYCAKSKTFLLSPSRTDCAVVTVANPFVSIFAAKTDVALSPNDRAYIETALIQAEDFNLFGADGDHRVPKVNDEESATHKLRLTNTVTKQHRYIRFYPLNVYKQQSRPQANFKTSPRFVPIWQTKLDVMWWERYYYEFWSRWINGYGRQITRPANKVLQLAFGKKSLVTCYNVRADDFAEDAIVSLDAATKGKPLKVCVLSKDIVSVAHALAHMEINGVIALSVNTHALLFAFKTNTAAYQIAVPTCDMKGKRDKQYFEALGE